ncbi:MAG: hypothetical protein NZ483_01350 [Verrucomicrobiae bacterium]|nr:hypothetical protein [Verrucomicrobiae bacterium]
MSTMSVIRRVSAGWLVMVCAIGVWAQEPQSRLVDELVPPDPWPVREEEVQRRGEAVDPEEGGDLGRQVLLRRHPSARALRLSSTSDWFYHSNILLLEQGRLDDGVFQQTFEAAWSPRWDSAWLGTVYARYVLVRYHDHDELDFDGNEVGVTLSHRLWYQANVYGGLRGLRLYLEDGEDEFFKGLDLMVGIWRGHAWWERTWFFYGYQLDWRPTSPGSLHRVDNAGYVGLKFFPAAAWHVQLLYRLRWEEYVEVSRSDLNHLLSISATWDPTEFFRLRVSGEYGANHSGAPNFDYSYLAGGGSVQLQIRF